MEEILEASNAFNQTVAAISELDKTTWRRSAVHPAARALRHNIAALDCLSRTLTGANLVLVVDGFDESLGNSLPCGLLDDSGAHKSSYAWINVQSPVSWYSRADIIPAAFAGSSSAALPSARRPTFSVPRATSLTESSRFSSPGPSFPAASFQRISFFAAATSAAGQFVAELDSLVQSSTVLALVSLALLPGPVAGEPVASAPGGPGPGYVLVIREARLQKFRENLLRLVDGIRAALCLVLMLILSALSRRPDAISFVLILLAASRRFGRRGDPGDHHFPALTPIPVVIGEAARSV